MYKRQVEELFPELDLKNLAKYCKGKLQHNKGGGTPYRTYRRRGKVRSPPKRARSSDVDIELVKRESEDDEGQSSTDVSSTESERGLRGKEVDQDDEEPEEMVDMVDNEIEGCSEVTAAIREEVESRRRKNNLQCDEDFAFAHDNFTQAYEEGGKNYATKWAEVRAATQPGLAARAAWLLSIQPTREKISAIALSLIHI